MRIRIVEKLDEVEAAAWDALGGDRNPLISHAFLAGLERYGCLGSTYGWYPRHVLVEDDAGRLLAAMPLYAKTNGYGEFVFDWAWESAWERSGLRYYPKLVASVPYTPATGPRLLVHPDADGTALRRLLIRQAVGFAGQQGVSGLHWLFPDATDLEALRAEGLALRMGCQYHWRNDGYRDFDDFLERFSSKKRKNVRRERRRVVEQGVKLRILHGDEVSDSLWGTFHRFYTDTFEKKMGIPTLSLDFFRETGRALGSGVVMVLAEHGGAPVAAALCYRSHDSLYGRYWGCARDYDGLHFEACYYQGIDYCIREGLQRFEPGAQGEHKIPRGFLPTATWSAHWLAHEELGRVVADFCLREQQAMARHCRQLMVLSPFREGAAPGETDVPRTEVR
jgi:uncharacterized protein